MLITYGEEPAPELPGVAEKIEAGTLSLLLSRGNDYTLNASAGTQNPPLTIASLLAAIATGTPIAGAIIDLAKN